RWVVPDVRGADEIAQSDFFGDQRPGGDVEVYLGIGDNTARRRLFDQARAAGFRMPPCIAPNAFVARHAELADGAHLGAGAWVGSRAIVGAATIINSLSSVDHD